MSNLGQPLVSESDVITRLRNDLDIAEKLREQAFRVVGILTERAGGEVVLSKADMTRADQTLETSEDVATGAITIRVVK